MVGEHIDPKAYTSGMKNLIAGKAKKMKPLWYPGGYGSPVPRAAVPCTGLFFWGVGAVYSRPVSKTVPRMCHGVVPYDIYYIFHIQINIHVEVKCHVDCFS